MTLINEENNYNENIQKNKIMGSRKDGLSSHLTLINFMKGMIGSGILTLPIVFKQAGLWTGFFFSFYFWIFKYINDDIIS
uniref:Amino acid transporter transmembrane domain-containing protein n=1 Tax=Meloidogyne incognita TaxID=6306 RepID=A0A914MRA9_MELIC